MYGGREGSQHMQTPQHLQIQKTLSSITQHARCNFQNTRIFRKHLQIQKNTCKLRKTPALSSQHVRCKYSQHEQIGKQTASNDNGNVSGGTIISDGPIAGWWFYSITDVLRRIFSGCCQANPTDIPCLIGRRIQENSYWSPSICSSPLIMVHRETLIYDGGGTRERDGGGTRELLLVRFAILNLKYRSTVVC